MNLTKISIMLASILFLASFETQAKSIFDLIREQIIAQQQEAARLKQEEEERKKQVVINRQDNVIPQPVLQPVTEVVQPVRQTVGNLQPTTLAAPIRPEYMFKQNQLDSKTGYSVPHSRHGLRRKMASN